MIGQTHPLYGDIVMEEYEVCKMWQSHYQDSTHPFIDTILNQPPSECRQSFENGPNPSALARVGRDLDFFRSRSDTGPLFFIFAGLVVFLYSPIPIRSRPGIFGDLFFLNY